MTTTGSRVVLALVLLSGGIVLTLAALVVRPDESHNSTEAAAVVSDHQAAAEEDTSGDTTDHDVSSEVTSGAESENSEDVTGAETEHTDSSEGTTEVTSEHAGTDENTNGTEDEHEAAGQNQAESVHEEQESNTILGVDLNTYNLASPRLVFVLVGLTVLLGVGLMILRSVWMLAACLVLGLAGVVITFHEATRAGEELGIFVPLPILATVLYGAAASLAGLALIGIRTESLAAQSAKAALGTTPPVMSRH